MSRLQTITDPNWLHNPHAGELLATEFMEPLSIDTVALAAAINAPAVDLQEVIDGRRSMSGELDLRLTHYFQMSAGFFLGLQNDYELLEAKRLLNGELDRIVPRAA